MIGPEHEGPQRGEGDFHDVVSVEFCDGPNELFGFVRIAHAPATETANAIGVLFRGKDCAVAEDGARAELETVEPLRRWRASLDAGKSGFEIELTATSPPLELDAEVAATAGVTQYEQLCDVKGSVTVGGQRRKLACPGRRVHVWGAPDWSAIAARRSVYVALEGEGALTLQAARPAGSRGQDVERSSGHLRPAGLGNECSPLERVLLSTVYNEDHAPLVASAELYRPDDEFGHRLAGEALCDARIESDRRQHQISFFRWSLDGQPGWGSYHSVSAS